MPLLGTFSTRFLHFSAWGETFSSKLLQWLLLLRWPDDDAGPLSQKVGVSWAELALSWMMHFGQYLPVLRQDDRGQKRVIQPCSYESAQAWGISLSELGQSCKCLFDHTLALIPEQILPHFERNRKVDSLYLQGAKQFVNGMSRRPSFPSQRKVAVLIQQMVISNPEVPLLRQTPICVSLLTRDFVSPLAWSVCYKNACSAMKRVRAS